MHDIASQLVLKWARRGSDYRIPVTSDFTRLTLDTIALCAMDYRFNSFYDEDMHPFVKAMNTTLSVSSDRLKIGSMLRKMLPWDHTVKDVQEARQYMQSVAKELVQRRRNNPTEKRDLLNAMVKGKDPKTGETMEDGLITSNMITFLIAGHETTSGLLSFAFLLLLKNPEAYFQAQQEVDRVVGRKKLTAKHLNDLKYLNAVLRETLRLCPTVPAFTRAVRNDNPNAFESLAGGEYAVSKDDRMLCLIAKAQRDPKVYGEDANEFKPQRMLDDNFNRLPKGAWKPFGTGVRACIGRAFAWQEALAVTALLLQNFNLSLNDPSYDMKVKQTLTLKPEGFHMRASLRDGITPTSLQNLLSGDIGAVEDAVDQHSKRSGTDTMTDLKPMTILYGSNAGTCQSLAQKLSVDARRHGYFASVMEMDATVDSLPKDRPVAIITSSYEGQPPDDAAQFVAWLESLTDFTMLDGVNYAVFGCGHSDWSSTFHRIPRLCDDLLQKHGGKRIADIGLADTAKGDMFSDFDVWADGSFWASIAPSSSTTGPIQAELDVDISSQDRGSYLRQDVKSATVVDTKMITAPGEPEKRHLEVNLPDGMTYQAGDYLAVLPLNPPENVSRVMRHFKVAKDATITIRPGNATFLPTGVTLAVSDLLRGFVELSLPATRKDVQTCLAATQDAVERAVMEAYADNEMYTEITEQRVSVLDLIEKYKSVQLTFGAFLALLPPLRPRHYSISSSPLHDPTKCTITYSIINEAALSGIGNYIGVTGAYLSNLKPGDDIQVSVRSTNKFFHLPADPLETPILMFAGGTGLAPFRGFLQERAVQLKAGRKLAPALLFFGCRSSTADLLYADEMDEWIRAGVVDVRYAFSREPEAAQGCKYVQDRILKDKADVRRMWQDGAKVFVCGSSALSHEVGKAARILVAEAAAERGETLTDGEAAEWFKQRRNERFVVDVFA